MDRKKVIEENGKVFSTGKIECLEIFYKDKDYETESVSINVCLQRRKIFLSVFLIILNYANHVSLQ